MLCINMSKNLSLKVVLCNVAIICSQNNCAAMEQQDNKAKQFFCKVKKFAIKESLNVQSKLIRDAVTKLDDQWIKNSEYDDSIYQVISDAVSKCVSNEGEFHKKLGMIIEFENATPDKVNYSRENWNALIIYNVIAHVCKDQFYIKKSGEPKLKSLSDTIDFIVKLISSYCTKNYEKAIEEYDEDYLNTIKDAGEDIKKYFTVLDLKGYIKREAKAKIAPNIDVIRESNPIELKMKYESYGNPEALDLDRDLRGYKIIITDSDEDNLDVKRYIQHNTERRCIDLPPDMKVKLIGVPEYCEADRKIWPTSLLAKNIKTTNNLQELRVKAQICSILGAIYNAPELRRWIYRISNIQLENGFATTVALKLKILYNTIDLCGSDDEIHANINKEISSMMGLIASKILTDNPNAIPDWTNTVEVILKQLLEESKEAKISDTDIPLTKMTYRVTCKKCNNNLREDLKLMPVCWSDTTIAKQLKCLAKNDTNISNVPNIVICPNCDTSNVLDRHSIIYQLGSTLILTQSIKATSKMGILYENDLVKEIQIFGSKYKLLSFIKSESNDQDSLYPLYYTKTDTEKPRGIIAIYQRIP